LAQGTRQGRPGAGDHFESASSISTPGVTRALDSGAGGLDAGAGSAIGAEEIEWSVPRCG
jgi:hypothetical protein